VEPFSPLFSLDRWKNFRKKNLSINPPHLEIKEKQMLISTIKQRDIFWPNESTGL